MDNQLIKRAIQINIKTYIPNCNIDKLNENIHKIENHLPQDIRYILIKLFVQLGESDKEQNNNALNYKDKNNVFVSIQPKISNYVTFKSKENADKYMSEELSPNDLYLFLNVNNSRIEI